MHRRPDEHVAPSDFSARGESIQAIRETLIRAVSRCCQMTARAWGSAAKRVKAARREEPSTLAICLKTADADLRPATLQRFDDRAVLTFLG
jgi:hypothetical protein